MSKDQTVFNFDLEETLFFEKGQEVSEMLSISLDPEISIKTFDDYVSIRGVIKLHGEYQKIEQLNRGEEPLSFPDHHSRRYLEQIEDCDNGNALFTHHFPIEISIPSYRVVDLDDITVLIDSFDYELPDENQLKINSSIHINGINQHVDLPQDKVKTREEVEELQTDLIEESFEFEIKKERQSEEVRSKDDVDLEELFDNDEENKVETDDGRLKKHKTQTFEAFFKKDDNKEEVIQEIGEAEKTEELDKVDGVIEEVVEDVVNQDAETIEAEVVERPTEEAADEKKAADSLDYMARMFSDKEDGSDQKYAQMRICIVQEADTLESIAERYKVPKLQLLKQNRLEDDDLIEGQLISIPLK